MRFFIVAFLTFSITFSVQSQDKKDLAKVYFKRAKKSYIQKNITKTTKYLAKAKLFFEGIIDEEMAIFGAKFLFESSNFVEAEKYLKAFFKLHKNKKSELYKEMLLLYTDNLDALDDPEKFKENQILKVKKAKKDTLTKVYLLAKKNFLDNKLDETILAIEKFKALNPEKTSKEYIELNKLLITVKDKLKSPDTDTVKVEEDEIDVEDLNSDGEDGQGEYEKAVEDVPFAIIEEVPVFPGCYGNNNSELKSCFSKKVQKHFSRKFNSDLPNELGLSAGKKMVLISFVINREGIVTNVNARAPHPKLKDEVVRVVKSLPLMKPGKQRGEAVNVKYSLPFTLNVE